ncbi:hypothetical protein Ciccas_009222 [Cichlidogyrus casuarinus]|uniref:G-protein coupled receptors family 3 profile domain-containing protein n=1 Tax=Cichlidogyrus casuarinus TaxID=1844966 RepID=A0ABD2PY34_9PLAT
MSEAQTDLFFSFAKKYQIVINRQLWIGTTTSLGNLMSETWQKGEAGAQMKNLILLLPRTGFMGPSSRYTDTHFKVARRIIRYSQVISTKPTTHISDPSLQFFSNAIVHAVEAIFNTAEQMAKEGTWDPNDPMDQGSKFASNLTETVFMRTLRNIDFTSSITMQNFHFDKTIDGPPTVSVFGMLNSMAANKEWSQMATYDFAKGTGPESLIYLNRALVIQFQKEFPRVVCSEDCRPGEAVLRRSICCWRCEYCSIGKFINYSNDSAQRFLPPGRRESECVYCPPGKVPTENKTDCKFLDDDIMSLKNPLAIGVTVVSGFLFIAAVSVGVILVARWNTPLIRATGRETSVVLYFGILASCLCSILVLALEPSPSVCTFGLTSPGICITICYSAIISRIRRIVRIFVSHSLFPFYHDYQLRA